MKGKLLTKTEASIYLLGYEDREYINYLIQEGYIGIRVLPGKKTHKIIYEGDLQKFIESQPYVNGSYLKTKQGDK